MMSGRKHSEARTASDDIRSRSDRRRDKSEVCKKFHQNLTEEVILMNEGKETIELRKELIAERDDDKKAKNTDEGNSIKPKGNVEKSKKNRVEKTRDSCPVRQTKRHEKYQASTENPTHDFKENANTVSKTPRDLKTHSLKLRKSKSSKMKKDSQSKLIFESYCSSLQLGENEAPNKMLAETPSGKVCRDKRKRSSVPSLDVQDNNRKEIWSSTQGSQTHLVSPTSSRTQLFVCGSPTLSLTTTSLEIPPTSAREMQLTLKDSPGIPEEPRTESMASEVTPPTSFCALATAHASTTADGKRRSGIVPSPLGNLLSKLAKCKGRRSAPAFKIESSHPHFISGSSSSSLEDTHQKCVHAGEEEPVADVIEMVELVPIHYPEEKCVRRDRKRSQLTSVRRLTEAHRAPQLKSPSGIQTLPESGTSSRILSRKNTTPPLLAWECGGSRPTAMVRRKRVVANVVRVGDHPFFTRAASPIVLPPPTVFAKADCQSKDSEFTDTNNETGMSRSIREELYSWKLEFPNDAQFPESQVNVEERSTDEDPSKRVYEINEDRNINGNRPLSVVLEDDSRCSSSTRIFAKSDKEAGLKYDEPKEEHAEKREQQLSTNKKESDVGKKVAGSQFPVEMLRDVLDPQMERSGGSDLVVGEKHPRSRDSAELQWSLSNMLAAPPEFRESPDSSPIVQGVRAPAEDDLVLFDIISPPSHMYSSASGESSDTFCNNDSCLEIGRISETKVETNMTFQCPNPSFPVGETPEILGEMKHAIFGTKDSFPKEQKHLAIEKATPILLNKETNCSLDEYPKTPLDTEASICTTFLGSHAEENITKTDDMNANVCVPGFEFQKGEYPSLAEKLEISDDNVMFSVCNTSTYGIKNRLKNTPYKLQYSVPEDQSTQVRRDAIESKPKKDFDEVDKKQLLQSTHKNDQKMPVTLSEEKVVNNPSPLVLDNANESFLDLDQTQDKICAKAVSSTGIKLSEGESKLLEGSVSCTKNEAPFLVLPWETSIMSMDVPDEKIPMCSKESHCDKTSKPVELAPINKLSCGSVSSNASKPGVFLVLDNLLYQHEELYTSRSGRKVYWNYSEENVSTSSLNEASPITDCHDYDDDDDDKNKSHLRQNFSFESVDRLQVPFDIIKSSPTELKNTNSSYANSYDGMQILSSSPSSSRGISVPCLHRYLSLRKDNGSLIRKVVSCSALRKLSIYEEVGITKLINLSDKIEHKTQYNEYSEANMIKTLLKNEERDYQEHFLGSKEKTPGSEPFPSIGDSPHILPISNRCILQKEYTNKEVSHKLLPISNRFVVQEGDSFREPSSPFKFVFTLHGPRAVASSIDVSDGKESENTQSIDSNFFRNYLLPKGYINPSTEKVMNENNTFNLSAYQSRNTSYTVSHKEEPILAKENPNEQLRDIFWGTKRVYSSDSVSSNINLKDNAMLSKIISVIKMEDLDDINYLSCLTENHQPSANTIENISKFCKELKQYIDINSDTEDSMKFLESIDDITESKECIDQLRDENTDPPISTIVSNLKSSENQNLESDRRIRRHEKVSLLNQRKTVSLKLFSEWDTLNKILDQFDIYTYTKPVMTRTDTPSLYLTTSGSKYLQDDNEDYLESNTENFDKETVNISTNISEVLLHKPNYSISSSSHFTSALEVSTEESGEGIFHSFGSDEVQKYHDITVGKVDNHNLSNETPSTETDYCTATHRSMEKLSSSHSSSNFNLESFSRDDTILISDASVSTKVSQSKPKDENKSTIISVKQEMPEKSHSATLFSEGNEDIHNNVKLEISDCMLSDQSLSFVSLNLPGLETLDNKMQHDLLEGFTVRFLVDATALISKILSKVQSENVNELKSVSKVSTNISESEYERKSTSSITNILKKSKSSKGFITTEGEVKVNELILKNEDLDFCLEENKYKTRDMDEITKNNISAHESNTFFDDTEANSLSLSELTEKILIRRSNSASNIVITRSNLNKNECCESEVESNIGLQNITIDQNAFPNAVCETTTGNESDDVLRHICSGMIPENIFSCQEIPYFSTDEKTESKTSQHILTKVSYKQENIHSEQDHEMNIVSSVYSPQQTLSNQEVIYSHNINEVSGKEIIITTDPEMNAANKDTEEEIVRSSSSEVMFYLCPSLEEPFDEEEYAIATKGTTYSRMSPENVESRATQTMSGIFARELQKRSKSLKLSVDEELQFPQTESRENNVNLLQNEKIFVPEKINSGDSLIRDRDCENDIKCTSVNASSNELNNASNFTSPIELNSHKSSMGQPFGKKLVTHVETTLDKEISTKKQRISQDIADPTRYTFSIKTEVNITLTEPSLDIQLTHLTPVDQFHSHLPKELPDKKKITIMNTATPLETIDFPSSQLNSTTSPNFVLSHSRSESSKFKENESHMPLLSEVTCERDILSSMSYTKQFISKSSKNIHVRDTKSVGNEVTTNDTHDSKVNTTTLDSFNEYHSCCTKSESSIKIQMEIKDSKTNENSVNSHKNHIKTPRLSNESHVLKTSQELLVITTNNTNNINLENIKNKLKRFSEEILPSQRYSDSQIKEEIKTRHNETNHDDINGSDTYTKQYRAAEYYLSKSSISHSAEKGLVITSSECNISSLRGDIAEKDDLNFSENVQKLSSENETNIKKIETTPGIFQSSEGQVKHIDYPPTQGSCKSLSQLQSSKHKIKTQESNASAIATQSSEWETLRTSGEISHRHSIPNRRERALEQSQHEINAHKRSALSVPTSDSEWETLTSSYDHSRSDCVKHLTPITARSVLQESRQKKVSNRKRFIKRAVGRPYAQTSHTLRRAPSRQEVELVFMGSALHCTDSDESSSCCAEWEAAESQALGTLGATEVASHPSASRHPQFKGADDSAPTKLFGNIGQTKCWPNVATPVVSEDTPLPFDALDPVVATGRIPDAAPAGVVPADAAEDWNEGDLGEGLLLSPLHQAADAFSHLSDDTDVSCGPEGEWQRLRRVEEWNEDGADSTELGSEMDSDFDTELDTDDTIDLSGPATKRARTVEGTSEKGRPRRPIVRPLVTRARRITLRELYQERQHLAVKRHDPAFSNNVVAFICLTLAIVIANSILSAHILTIFG